MSDPPFSVADNMNATDNDFAEFESADDWEGYIDWDNQLVNTTFSPSENQQ